jgi:outer membrane protein assembly factor BamB
LHAAGDVWPTCHGDYNLGGVSPASVPDAPVRLWRVETGDSIESAPVAGGGLVFFVSGSRVSAVKNNGSAAWSWAIPVPPRGGGETAARESFIAPLLFAAGNLVCAGDSGTVYALDAGNGRLRWKHDIGERITGQPGFCLSGSSGECVLVVAQPAGAIRCLSLGDGRSVWNTDPVGRFDGHPGVGGGRVVIGGCDGSFHAFSIEDGAVMGKIGIGAGREMAGGVTVVGNLSLAGNRAGGLACADWARGTIAWEHMTSGGELFSIAAVHDERVVFAAGDGTINAVSLKDGGKLWTFDIGGIEAASPAIAGNRVVATVDGAIHLLDLRSGKQIWSFRVADALSAPAIVDGMIVVASDDGHVLAFGAKRHGEERSAAQP